MHIHGLMPRVNPLQAKNVEFLSMTQFGFDIIFEKFNFTKVPYEEIEEAVQVRVLEYLSNTDILEFLGRSN